jgi:ATP-binding cassette, subfamily B, bacterial MsbA
LIAPVSSVPPAGSSDLKRLLARVVRPYAGILGLGLTGSAGDLAAQLTLPWILRFLIDDVLGRRRPDGLEMAIALLIAAALATTGFRTLGRYSYTRLSARIAIDLRDRLAGHLRRLALGDVYQRRSGEVMSLFTNDVPVVADFYEGVVGQLIINTLRFAVTLTVLITFFHGLALIALLLLPLYSLLPILFSRRLKAASTDLQRSLAELSGDLQESVAATREIKAFDRERWDAGRLHAAFTRLLRPQLRLALFEALSSATFLLFWISAGVIYWVGGRQVLAGRMTVGELLAAISYFTYLDVPISSFVGLNARWQTVRAAGERLLEFLQVPAETPDRPGARPRAAFCGEVAFEAVDFAYEPGVPVLAGVDFRVAAGERVALVGPSGAGKTSLVSLLLRLYEPTAGRVLVDGQEIRDLTASSLRAAVGVVFQDSYLFPGTIEENIRFGNATASGEQVAAAARAADAHDFVTALPGGYQAILGERGVTLSAGQRQRLAIARTLLRDPRILILDEATSAVDSESERAVRLGLERLMKGRTTFIIAHRLSTVLGADRIVVLENGRVRAVGAHDELIGTCDLYGRLYAAQLAL